ncbi:hypothetical protein [Alloactinosynnema sp. L-07]|nr:hypothetical protein [Alloactinosynnema sp. L-07]
MPRNAREQTANGPRRQPHAAGPRQRYVGQSRIVAAIATLRASLPRG